MIAIIAVDCLITSGAGFADIAKVNWMRFSEIAGLTHKIINQKGFTMKNNEKMHQARGFLIKQILYSLISLEVEVKDSYKEDKVLCESITASFKNLEDARFRLVGHLQNEFPGLSDEKADSIYYGLALHAKKVKEKINTVKKRKPAALVKLIKKYGSDNDKRLLP